MKNEIHLHDLMRNAGIDKLNDMQEVAVTQIAENSSTVLLSPTGSGKTLAFLLPLVQLLDQNVDLVQCLIIVPTRELGLQMEQVWKKLGTGFKVNLCYGGHSIETEIKNLSQPPAVLIGTPGRLSDHLHRGSFTTEKITTLILDEFDKSLQLGFHEEMSYLISNLPSLSKRVLVSATSEVEIPSFTGVVHPVKLNFIPKSDSNDKLSIKLVVSPEKDKIDSLFHLICSLDSEAALVFCNHREAAERISDLLSEKGIISTYYHGGMDQDERERALIQFRNGTIDYLITTDLAARGLDIPEMNHVVHYHLPSKGDEFIHRNGRTARMRASGTAYILLHESEPKPSYLPAEMPIYEIEGSETLPKHPAFHTLYISGGKKNKVNKMDIVGFFSKIGKLEKEDLGRIEVKDFASFAAVKTHKVRELLANIKDQKLKGKKYKIEVARNVIDRIPRD